MRENKTENKTKKERKVLEFADFPVVLSLFFFPYLFLFYFVFFQLNFN